MGSAEPEGASPDPANSSSWKASIRANSSSSSSNSDDRAVEGVFPRRLSCSGHRGPGARCSVASPAAVSDRGEQVPAILRAVDGALAGAGLALGELRSGDDTYRVGVMRRTRASSRVWGLDRPSHEVLYTIVCPCGGMNVWQLPEAEGKPGDGECDSCGLNLFDPAGTPIVPMVVENVG